MLTVHTRRVEIPTYVPYPADKNPIFFEKRNVQGASGKVFPMAYCDRLEMDFRPVAYEQIAMENEYIDVALLPELGGRVYSALDKTNGYDFVYRNRVIKPQRIGLCGPWVSGGIEFNWPQHHRPTTMLPLSSAIERHADGSATVWMGEVEPLNRTKGMVGITMYPGKSYFHAKVRLFNRTPYPQTFLWWANLAVAVSDEYRAVFPEDIHWSSDHAWALMSDFPVIRGEYKGVDFGAGVDVRNFGDMPLQTSFFTYNSKHDFLSGYDFGRRSGVVHIADRHVAPGKKMFTWGTSDLGRVWYENLTDADGPYIELMTGVYTCNQPDFSWLAPYEQKTAEQYWYPIRGIGEVKSATLNGAVGFLLGGGRADLALNATGRYDGARAVITCGDGVVYEAATDIAPDRPFAEAGIAVPDAQPHAFRVALYAADGSLLVDYRPEKPEAVEIPEPLPPAPPPASAETVEDLYLHALHVWQYRHPCFSPLDYLEEALRRAPGDIRCNTLLGKILCGQGAFKKAEAHLSAACRRSVTRNPNPYDTEPFYQLGVVWRFLGKEDEAYESLFRSVWGFAWKSAGYTLIAEIDCARGDWALGLAHADEALSANGANRRAARMRATILRALGRHPEALDAVGPLIQEDPLDAAAVFEKALILEALDAEADAAAALGHWVALTQRDPENHLDIALEYMRMGRQDDASAALLPCMRTDAAGEASPVILYYLAHFARRGGDERLAMQYAMRAKAAPVEGCLHSRLESIAVLQEAAANAPDDANAPYLLGNIYYGNDQFDEAIGYFEASVARGAPFPTAYRNLAIGYFDKQGKKREAGALMQKAFDMNPADHRVFFELVQYGRNTGAPLAERMSLLERHADLVGIRDDLYIKAVSTYLEAGAYAEAVRMLSRHTFHPYEGGEGVVIREHIAAHLLLGMEKLSTGDGDGALALFEAAGEIPPNYNEGKRPVFREHAHLSYCAGLAYQRMGRRAQAEERFERSARDDSEYPEMDYYAARSLQALGRDAEASARIQKMRRATDALLATEGAYPYFTKDIVMTMPFEHDTRLNNEARCFYYYGLAEKALGNEDAAKRWFEQALERKPTMYMASVMAKNGL